MKLFDAQARTATRTDDELRNLRYFGTTHVVTTPQLARANDADAVLAQLRALLDDEVARLRRLDLHGYAAIGLLPPAAPRRAHPELWSAFEACAHDPRVVAIGEVGVWEDTARQWQLFDAQLQVARRAELAVILTPPEQLPVTMTYKMMARVGEVGIAPERCLVNALDEATLGTVCEEGFVAGVAVGGGGAPRGAARVIAKTLDDVPEALERLVLTSALSHHASDILSMAKTVDALKKLLPATALERVCYANAAQLFVPNY